MEILGTVVSGLFGSAIGGSGLGLIGTCLLYTSDAADE